MVTRMLASLVMDYEAKTVRVWDIGKFRALREELGLGMRTMYRLLNQHVLSEELPIDLPTFQTMQNRLEAGKGPDPRLQNLIEDAFSVDLDQCWKEIKR